MDKRYWLATCQHGHKVALSTYPSTREEFAQKCGVHPHEETDRLSISELTEEEHERELDKMPSWVRPLIELRKEAKKKIFSRMETVRYDEIPCATIEGWRLRLSVDHGDGPFMFHLSVRHSVKRLGDVSADDFSVVAEFLLALGAVPLPDGMPTLEAIHFRWPALDVGGEDLN